MGITKEQWKAIEDELSHPYGCCVLMCDGYRLSLEVRCVSRLRYGIHAFVNGVWKGEWVMNAECEETRRFMCPESRFVHTPKMRASLVKIYGGKRCPRDKLADINKKLTLYTPIWPSVTLLRRHLVKHNTSIELVRIGYGSETTIADTKPNENSVAA
jgi:hypothetical protein